MLRNSKRGSHQAKKKKKIKSRPNDKHDKDFSTRVNDERREKKKKSSNA